MDVRVANEADVPVAIALAKTVSWKRRAFLEQQAALGNLWVAVDDSAIVGFIVWNREFFERPFVWLVMAAESRRRRGVAGALFAAVEGRCSGERLYTSTNLSNDAMKAFLMQRRYRWMGEIDLDPGDPEVFYCIDVPVVTGVDPGALHFA